MTSQPAPLRTLACPTCGAPLEIKVDEATIHCQYCNAVVENPEYHPPQPVKPAAPLPIPQPASSVSYAPETTSGCAKPAISMMLIILVITAVIGGGIYWIVRASAGASLLTAVFPLQIDAPVLMIKSESGGPNVIARTEDVGTNKYQLSLLDLGSHKAVWNALGQKDSWRADAILASDTAVFVIIDNRLVSLQLSDGKQVWESSLPDSLAVSCKPCAFYQDGQVIVLTTDNTLGAYDANTGHQTWEKHFDNTGRSLYPVKEGVTLAYATKNGAALGVFATSDGEEKTHIEPTCKLKGDTGMGDKMAVDSSILVDASGQSGKATLFLGFMNACVQRWDLASGKMDWEHVEKGGNLEIRMDAVNLEASGSLFYVQRDQLRSLDAATGQKAQTLDEAQDYTLIPLLVKEQRLVVRAKRSRGTTRFELWGYDLTTGKNLWKHPILQGTPIDPPDEGASLIDEDASGWTIRQTADSLWLMTFQVKPNQVNLAQINLDTGEWTNQKSLRFGIDDSTDLYDSPVSIDSQDHIAWFAMFNRIYAIDPQAKAFPYRWP